MGKAGSGCHDAERRGARKCMFERFRGSNGERPTTRNALTAFGFNKYLWLLWIAATLIDTHIPHTHTHTHTHTQVISANIFVLCSLSQGVTVTGTAYENRKSVPSSYLFYQVISLFTPFSHSTLAVWEAPAHTM